MRAFICLCLLIGGFAPSAWAGGGESVRSAFLFAERGEWSEARAHARKSGDPALKKLIHWLYALDTDSGAPFDEIARFVRDNPHWPQETRLVLRAEQSLRTSEPPDAALEEWFEAHPPISGLGKIKLAEMRMRQGQRMDSETVRVLVREAWQNGDFDENEERRILAVYGSLLRQEDHLMRTDRLLWEEKTKPARRMLEGLPEAQQALARARIALIEEARDVNFHVSRVPNSLRADAGLVFARLQWRAKRGDDAGVREMLLAAPTPLPYPEKWWKPREAQVRKAIDDKEYRTAMRLLASHHLSGGQEYAEALWLSGWLALEFLDDPQGAYLHFYRMYDGVNYPVSKARAAYWAGRAAEKANDGETAKNWYVTAARHPTTFYGQLAYARTHGGEMPSLPVEPVTSGKGQWISDRENMAAAMRLAAAAGKMDIALPLLNHLIDTAEDATQAVQMAAAGPEARNAALGVKGAKRALQRGVIMAQTGYPRPRLPDELHVEPSLALAVMRQESEFDTAARSRAGAVGLMQLLPRTAKEQAKKTGLSYAESRLLEPAYNIRVGSAYLNRLINAYDGSYVLAIAAYNAGPGNVRGWMANFGTPGQEVDAAVNWIEKIPYAETRNYVQRVMENLQVYRQLTGEKIRAENIVTDLTRS